MTMEVVGLLQRLSWVVVLGIAALVLSAAPALAAANSVAAGFAHTCAIKTGGTPVCWGLNSHGQATIPPGTGSVTQIAAGFTHSCAIKTGGTPVCWGENADGQATAPPDAVTQITTGRYHTCAVKTDGTPVCWGGNDDGQTTIPPGTGTVTQIRAGGYHTCAIKTDGTAVCWGDNGRRSRRRSPRRPAPSRDRRRLHAHVRDQDRRHACLLGRQRRRSDDDPAGIGTVAQVSRRRLPHVRVKTDGNPVCWGFNDDGQTTIPPGLGTVTQISAGLYHRVRSRPAAPSSAGASMARAARGRSGHHEQPAACRREPACSHTVTASGTSPRPSP